MLGKSPLYAGVGDNLTLIPLATASQRATYSRIAILGHSETIGRVELSPDCRFLLVTMKYPPDAPARIYRIGENASSIRGIDLQLSKEKESSEGSKWKFSQNSRWLVSYLRWHGSLLGSQGKRDCGPVPARFKRSGRPGR